MSRRHATSILKSRSSKTEGTVSGHGCLEQQKEEGRPPDMADVKHVTIKRSDVDKIIAYARKELPDEACGMIAGIDHDDGTREIKEVYLMTNVDHTNEHFSMDPQEQLKVIKDIRSRGYRLLGNWHSHPESPSRSSREDIRLAFDRKVSYLILSLMDRENPVLHSFHCEGGISTREELTVTD